MSQDYALGGTASEVGGATLSSKATIKSSIAAVKRKKHAESVGSSVGFVFEPKFEVVEKGQAVMEDEQVNLFEPCLSGSKYLD